MSFSAPLRVFVYGTLKPGEVNYQRYCLGKVTAQQDAIAQGQLFDLPFGYPAMTRGENFVQGVLLTLSDPSVLQALDRLEGYDPARSLEHNEYERRQVEVFSPDGESFGMAWAYFMSVERVKAIGGRWLEQGLWHSNLPKNSSSDSPG